MSNVHYPANSIVGRVDGVFQTPRGKDPSYPEESKVALVLYLGLGGMTAMTTRAAGDPHVPGPIAAAAMAWA